MARCHIIIGLCVIHLCLAVSYPGFEYDPRLIPQAQPYYQPQSNPYAQYGPYPQPMYNQYDQQGQGGYPLAQGQDGQDQWAPQEDEFLQMQQTPTDSGSPAPATTGGVVSDSASVQTPQDTSADATASPPTSTPTTNSNMDALDLQLAAALEAVKADMISKGKQVLEEKQWTDDVKAVIEQYSKKIINVYANIEKLKKDMSDLYKKKQQIINAQIQKSLTAKLKDSKDDLSVVQAALDKVTNTQAEFEQSKKDIQSTIDSIFAQLAELKGQPTPAAAAEGSTPASSSTEAGAATDAEKPAAGSEASSEDSADDTGDTDIVDRTAEINSKIDTIKSIVTALNKGSTTS